MEEPLTDAEIEREARLNARLVCRGLPAGLFEEAVQVGRVAIWEARLRWNPAAGPWGPWRDLKCRGAIRDWLRSEGYVTRSGRPRRQLLSLEEATGRMQAGLVSIADTEREALVRLEREGWELRKAAALGELPPLHRLVVLLWLDNTPWPEISHYTRLGGRGIKQVLREAGEYLARRLAGSDPPPAPPIVPTEVPRSSRERMS